MRFSIESRFLTVAGSRPIEEENWQTDSAFIENIAIRHNNRTIVAIKS